MKKLITAALIVLAACLVIAGIAFASQTQDLQPAYRLMDGNKELGVVYWLDYGLFVITDDGALYTCGCEEDTPCNQPSIGTPTTEPTDKPPEPTPVPSDTPEPIEAPKCNRGHRNTNDGEGCDPGNSSGQGEGDGRRAGEDREEE